LESYELSVMDVADRKEELGAGGPVGFAGEWWESAFKTFKTKQAVQHKQLLRDRGRQWWGGALDV